MPPLQLWRKLLTLRFPSNLFNINVHPFPLIHSQTSAIIHLFVQQTFFEQLLCARLCAQPLGHITEQNSQGACTHKAENWRREASRAENQRNSESRGPQAGMSLAGTI